MALSIKTFEDKGSSFVKVKDNAGAVAWLVKVNSFEADRPGQQYGPKDTLHCDVWIFPTDASFSGGKVDEYRNTMIQQTALVRAGKEYPPGEAFVAKIGQVPSKNGNPAWVFEQVDAATTAKVVKWWDEREAKIKTDMDEAPDFE